MLQGYPAIFSFSSDVEVHEHECELHRQRLQNNRHDVSAIPWINGNLVKTLRDGNTEISCTDVCFDHYR